MLYTCNLHFVAVVIYIYKIINKNAMELGECLNDKAYIIMVPKKKENCLFVSRGVKALNSKEHASDG